MSGPTDADRQAAREIAGAWWSWNVPNEVDGLRERIAQALADERQRALRPIWRLIETAPVMTHSNGYPALAVPKSALLDALERSRRAAAAAGPTHEGDPKA